MEARATLILRLTGPQQSWGETARFRVRETLPYPTLSGLIGLFRAAIGHGRASNMNEVRWLRDFTIGVRIDSEGQYLSDFHTRDLRPYNPTLSPSELKITSSYATMLTNRMYRSDAQYVTLINGEKPWIDRLSHAIDHPRWPLSLGRKRCIPDWAMNFGIRLEESFLDSSNLGSAITFPRIAKSEDQVWLHIIQQGNPTMDVPTSEEFPLTYLDNPLGSHPHHGHLPNKRSLYKVTPSIVPNRAALLAQMSNGVTS